MLWTVKNSPKNYPHTGYVEKWRLMTKGDHHVPFFSETRAVLTGKARKRNRKNGSLFLRENESLVREKF
ncbi:hypothetical protein DXF96_05525 [Heyndrickxia coagulans]|nr:hypothetical protein BIZ35_13960 [Heyndrickxia coagulans]KGT39458.1 hypothetical protein P421_04700 [Heyndrickxia coagulans P38]ATW81532.1 hypothetical protein CIW84_00010 [Heyndrickxia coagulans]AVD57770.1 hypothetical protein C3766_17840 [Heyndrickxia coagulans]AWP38720.1 hypothetical protein CYJ15_18070 [Heyndrickxia coagulans]